MKKALPILFVASTAFITAASLTVATNGSYTKLKAADNSVEHTITFTKNDVVSHTSQGYVDIVTINKKTQSGFDFGCVITVNLGNDGDAFSAGSILEVINENDDTSLSMSFQFKNVVSADSVTLNGSFDDGYHNSLSFNQSTQTTDGYKIDININNQSDVLINTIVVKYSCSY